jgi:ferredoxin-nitrate reductase
MKPDRTVRTTCSYCGVGCGIEVTEYPDGKLTLAGDGSHPVNRGKLCSKGLNLHYVVQNREDRLLHPMMRWSRDHPMEQVSWDAALNRASDVFSTLIQKHGPDSVAFYVSGQCLTEEYYVVNKLAKAGIGTNNIDTNSRLCMSSAVVGYKKALGEDAVSISYEDIDVCDTLFISGANPAWCHPIIFRRIEERKAAFPELKMIVAAPRKTQSTAMADIHLQLTPGTDTVLNNAIGRCIIENGDCDDDFISAHTEGFDVYRQVVLQTPVSEAAAICGVEEAGIREAALYIGQSNGFVSMWAMGLNQSVEGVNKNLSLINLSLITGQIGKPGAGPFSLTGQPNAMGGREVGGMCNLLPAHRDLNNENHRREVAAFWNVPLIPATPGLTATEMIHALNDGRLKATRIICTNPAVSIPDARLMDAAMARARFVVVQDISLRSDTVNYADLVLPAAGWLEKVGTMTNSDRRISMVNRLVDPPGEARPDVDILCDFAERMKFDGFDFESEEAIFNEHRALTRGTNIDISGLSYGYLRENGTAQWPFPEGSAEGTPRLFSGEKEIWWSTQRDVQKRAGTPV